MSLQTKRMKEKANLIILERKYNIRKLVYLRISKDKEYHIREILSIKKNKRVDLFLKSQITRLICFKCINLFKNSTKMKRRGQMLKKKRVV